MSATGSLAEDSKSWFEAMQRTVGNPVRSASLFYTLYRFVEVEGVDELRFDYERLRDRQHHDWFRYGVYSVAKEFTNAGDRYYIEGETLDQVRAKDEWREPIDEHLDEIGLDDELARELFYTPYLWNQTGKTEPLIMDLLHSWNNEVGLLERPEEVVEAIKRAFQAMPGTTRDAPELSDGGNTGWVRNFNGPAWVSICDFLLSRDNLSKTGWVDTAWSIEHNNSSWIDKIRADNDERRAITEAVRDDMRPVHVTVVREVTKEILDAKRSEEFEYVVAWAAFFDQHEDLGLGIAPTWRELTGSSPPPPTEHRDALGHRR